MCPFPMTHRKWDAVGCALQSPAVKEEAFTLTCAASSFPSVTHVKPNVFIKPLKKKCRCHRKDKRRIWDEKEETAQYFVAPLLLCVSGWIGLKVCVRRADGVALGIISLH